MVSGASTAPGLEGQSETISGTPWASGVCDQPFLRTDPPLLLPDHIHRPISSDRNPTGIPDPGRKKAEKRSRESEESMEIDRD
jgi:hypothetical protein